MLISSKHGALQLKGVTGLPDDFPLQQDRLFCKPFFLIQLKNEPIFLLNVEVIWQRK